MDNRVFNVNGSGLPGLIAAMKLAFRQQAGFYDRSRTDTVSGWIVDPKKGLILLWSDSVTGCSKFMAPMTAEQVAPMVMGWLETDEAKAIPLSGWDADCQHDGNNSPGWRVFVEDWGHVGDQRYATCCITPAFMWHGK